jgi:hypothetical protein
MVILSTNEAAVKNISAKQTRVIVTGRIPRAADREAIREWAEASVPNLTRSKYAVLQWGRGGVKRKIRPWQYVKYCQDAGVHLQQGHLVVIEDSRGREVQRVPLAEIAMQIVRRMKRPEARKWPLKG